MFLAFSSCQTSHLASNSASRPLQPSQSSLRGPARRAAGHGNLVYDRFMAKAMFEVECPCCQAVLKVDPETRAVIAHTVPVKPPPIEDLAAEVAKLKGAGARRGRAFSEELRSREVARQSAGKEVRRTVQARQGRSRQPSAAARYRPGLAEGGSAAVNPASPRLVVRWVVRGMVWRSLRRFDFDPRAGLWTGSRPSPDRRQDDSIDPVN